MKAIPFALICCLATPAVTSAQSLTREVEVTVGHSSEQLNAGGIQGRVFGPVGAGWRIYLEGTWAAVSKTGSDAFGAVFPYDRRVRLMEAYVEKTVRPGGLLLGVRAGNYRTPFGIYNRSDHGYSGFVRAPLVRYGGNWAISNTALESGAAVLVGVPSFSVETSVGMPLDSGVFPRPRTVDAVVRAQAFYRSLVVGASYLNTRAYDEGPFVIGRTVFGGVDARWMYRGVQVRGEWLFGRPFNDAPTSGGYIDLIVHHIGMGPVTAVARAERLDYESVDTIWFPRRYTAGVRVRLWRELSLQVNVLRQSGGFMGGRATAVDAGVTQSIRF